MTKYDLSILIPARNEEWLARTVQDLLEHKKGNTQIIIGLDGQWANPGIPDHPDVIIVYYPEAIGQRALTNQLCKLSKAKYVMKVDAHTSWDDGFDVKMMADMKDDAVLAPMMRNLWAFNWKCKKCGSEWYQGPTPDKCLRNKKHPGDGTVETGCNGKDFERVVIWKPNPRRPLCTSYRFDKTLHFQYFPEYKDKQVGQVVESMSLQGSCFMLTREKYWELNICDEEHGSWGQQGTEVACKFWLSGGRVLVTKNTWYAHLFRTQGGDFGFPYPQSGKQIEHARKYSRELFLEGKWDKAIYPLSWLINKFSPVPGWDYTKGIIYYTDNRLDEKIATECQKQILKANLPIISVSLKPLLFGKNICLPLERGYETYFKQIITALENSTADIVFFCEHDVYYHPSYFDFVPEKKDTFYYNLNVWRLKYPENYAVTWDANQVAQLCCYRELALEWYKKKLAEFQRETFDRKFEPEDKFETWRSEFPNIDIRHNANLTKSKWSIDDFRNKATAINFTVGECPEWAKELVEKK